jgi:hypothetical protein
MNQIIDLVNHTESLLADVGIVNLNKKQAEDLEKNCDIEGVKIFQGGRQALFGAAFPVEDYPFSHVIVKPYPKLNLSQCILHIVSFFEFRKEFSGKKHLVGIPGQEEEWEIRSVYPLGFCKVKVGDRKILALIQEFSNGEKLKPLFKLSRVMRYINRKGFVMDPYPSNFRLSRRSYNRYVEYFDLIFTNRQLDVKRKIEEITGLDFN